MRIAMMHPERQRRILAFLKPYKIKAKRDVVREGDMSNSPYMIFTIPRTWDELKTRDFVNELHDMLYPN